MRPRTLSPLPRLAASLQTSVMLLMLTSAFSPHQFAFAADVDSIRSEDHNHERLLGIDLLGALTEDLNSKDEGYEADFLGYDRGIIGRAATLATPTLLENNIPNVNNLEQGQTNYYTFPIGSGRRLRRAENGDLLEGIDVETDPEGPGPELQQRATTSSMVYISVNVCLQPQPMEATTVDPPPQLQLYISKDSSNPHPGPGSKGVQEQVTLVGGATMQEVNTASDVYIALYGPNTTAYKNVWNAEVAASTDGFYHSYQGASGDYLRLADTDSSAALLVTNNITNGNSSTPEGQAVLDAPPPYVLFVSNTENRLMQGLQNSYCGLQQNADIRPVATGQQSGNVQTSLTTRGNGAPKQEFYLTLINSATTYQATLAAPSGENSTTHGPGAVGGGGRVWPVVNFTTLSDGNCAVIFNLSFCDEVAYAVPANPYLFSTISSLASFYDNATAGSYQFFQNALAQIPCETTPSSKYSLARSCDDCAAAYKQWLCAVTIPRCTDYSSTQGHLPRSIVNPFPNGTMLSAESISSANHSAAAYRNSRNPAIDQYVMPGPYREILPCDGLCYEMVQSCPSSMGFGCPMPGQSTFKYSYATDSDSGACSYPGREFGRKLNGAGAVTEPRLLMIVALVVTMWRAA